MIDSERFKLLYGPYVPPKCRLGDKLTCEYRGKEVVVRGVSDGLIQWPSSRRRGAHSLIVCGDLIRAVERESEIAVAHHWGVRREMVWKWRRALLVPAMTHGSRRLRIEYASETLTPEVRAKAREAMHSPEVRAKLSEVRRGRPIHPNARAAIRETGRRPKSEQWKRGQSERSRKMWENPEAYGLPPHRQWTDEAIAVIGTDTDRSIAKNLGLPLGAVRYKRERLGISRIAPTWKEHEIALLAMASDRELSRKLGRSSSAIQRKRKKLGIPTFGIRWTNEEIAMLGTASDHAVARKLGRSTTCVQNERERLGIPAFIRRWTEEEISWLGVDTDRAVAKALGRTAEAVKIQRNHRGIPAYRDE